MNNCYVPAWLANYCLGDQSDNNISLIKIIDTLI